MRTILRGGLLPLTLLIILGLTPHAARAATINVPAGQPTIQAAINAASNGDTVLVAPGTYYENINFMGKAITVTSSGGPAVTTIDGDAAGSVVTFSSNEGTNSVLSGFTITNGLGGNGNCSGAGITIYSASPTVKGNVITNNPLVGICAGVSSALIQANVITYNGDAGGVGGGVFIGGSGSVQLIGNQISSNVGGYGAGVAVNPGVTPTIENNTISGNIGSAGSVGSSYGGGIFIYGYALVVQNLITGNSAYQGGGVYTEGYSTDYTTPILVNNTVANNNSAAGSGVYISENPSGYPQTQIINNLVIASPGQTALSCDGSDGGQNDGLAPIVQFSDAFSSGGSGFAGNCAGMAGTNGNISADPLFLNGSSNFHLSYGSPAIDVGDDGAPQLPTTDLDGNPRIVNSVVDLGAYELLPTTDTVSLTSLTFGSQGTGTTSPAQTVTLTNTGGQKLLFSVSIDSGLTNDNLQFAETDDCGSAVAPG
ncbi:MAG: hypothetical protein DMG26_16610, partial [Acidobacteria bacterium]